MEHLGLTCKVFSIIDLSLSSERDFEETAQLYCQVWREPPWNETNWQIEEVKKDFKNNPLKENGIALIAVHDGKIVGFTSGWNIGPDEIIKRTNGSLGAKDFEGQNVFYIAELAIGRQYRQAGIGKQLSLDLISRAKANNVDRFLLRTDINATAARALYRSLGFSESQAADSQFADRTYWIL